MEPNVDPRLLRLRVELFTCLQTLQGEDKAYFAQLIDEIVQCMDIATPTVRPTGLDSSAALKADKSVQRSHISLQYDLHKKLLERAEKLLENGQHGEACLLIESAMRLRP